MATATNRTKPAAKTAPKPKRSRAERKARGRGWLRRQDPQRLAVLFEALTAGRVPEGMTPEQADRLRDKIEVFLSTDAKGAYAEGARAGELTAAADLEELREEAEAEAETAYEEGYGDGYTAALDEVDRLEVTLENEQQLKEAIEEAEARVAELEERKAELDARRKELQLEERELKAFEARIDRRADKAAGQVTGAAGEAEDEAEAEAGESAPEDEEK